MKPFKSMLDIFSHICQNDYCICVVMSLNVSWLQMLWPGYNSLAFKNKFYNTCIKIRIFWIGISTSISSNDWYDSMIIIFGRLRQFHQTW